MKVVIVIGDMKVVLKGSGGGVFINIMGVGDSWDVLIWDISFIKVGDYVLVSGFVGDYGVCVLFVCEDYGL